MEKDEFVVEQVEKIADLEERRQYDCKFLKKFLLASILPTTVLSLRAMGVETPNHLNNISFMFNGVQLLYTGEYIQETYKRYHENKKNKQYTLLGLNRWE